MPAEWCSIVIRNPRATQVRGWPALEISPTSRRLALWKVNPPQRGRVKRYEGGNDILNFLGFTRLGSWEDQIRGVGSTVVLRDCGDVQ